MAGVRDVTGWLGKQEYPEPLQMPVLVSLLCPRLILLLKTLPCLAFGMWNDRVLDLKQILNHPEMSVMIRDQDEDLFGYLKDSKVSEGD